MFGRMGGNRGPAVPASENPGEHGTWGGKAGGLAGLLHPIYPGSGILLSCQTNLRS